jgi:hypothetical protein
MRFFDAVTYIRFQLFGGYFVLFPSEDIGMACATAGIALQVWSSCT